MATRHPTVPPPLVVVMGPAGCGKTTVGSALAAQLAVPFRDADDLHPPDNRARMARGQPLDETHRAPWLERVHAELAAAAATGRGLVMACSALRAAHRSTLANGLPALRFVVLAVDRATLAARLAARPGHFFPASLLDSQLAAFEPPADALTVDGTRPVAELAAAIAAALRGPA